MNVCNALLNSENLFIYSCLDFNLQGLKIIYLDECNIASYLSCCLWMIFLLGNLSLSFADFLSFSLCSSPENENRVNHWPKLLLPIIIICCVQRVSATVFKQSGSSISICVLFKIQLSVASDLYNLLQAHE